MLLKMCCSSFSAFPGFTFDSSMGNFLRKKNRLINRICFGVRSIKKEKIMELQSESTKWKVQCMVNENNMKISQNQQYQ